MNEKFLSRGKREDNGEWITGYYVKLPEHHIIFDLDGDIHYIIPETIGRCTGLTDKNGKMIFEGDIVIDVNYEFNKYVVIFSNERCGFFPFAKGDGCGCCEINTLAIKFAEVIGNIHDNPEMLSRADMPVSNDVFQPVFQPTTPENFELMNG